MHFLGKVAPKVKRSEEFPAKFNWKEKEKLTPVLKQCPCQTCWAFASTGLLDSAALIAGYDLKENISPQQLLDCIDPSLLNKNSKGVPDACSGFGTHRMAFDYFKSTSKRYTISQYPLYSQGVYETMKCAVNSIYGNPMDIQIYNVVESLSNEASMKAFIRNYGPIYAIINVNAWPKTNEAVIDKNTCNVGKEIINHAVMVVGWDDEYDRNGEKIRVWIIKNSYGEGKDVVFIYLAN